MVIINNSHKNDDNSNLDIDNNANDGILNYRIDNMQIIILKNQRMLKINKNVKSVLTITTFSSTSLVSSN